MYLNLDFSPFTRTYVKISICILTCNRPDGLTDLLSGLTAITFTHCHSPELEVVVIDNYVTGNAYNICTAFIPLLHMPLIFITEQRRGISFARNRAIEAVSDDTDFIAFLDDDEIPEPNWLDELLYTSKMYNADIVNGVIVPSFTSPFPKWIEKGGFFYRDRPPTGQVIFEARTGNSLIRRDLFHKLGNFDHRFALTGGEDTHFSMRAFLAGYKIVASNESIVYESIPASRMSTKWLLLRAYRTGNTFIRCKKYLNPSISLQLFWSLRGMSRMTRGLLQTPLSIFYGQIHLVKSLQSICNGAGLLSGLFGYSYREYKTIVTV